MGFDRKVPASAGELHGYLVKIQKNMGHVKSVKVNPSNGHLEIDLDFAANVAGNPDMYMPIKRGKTNEAQQLVERLMTQGRGGFPPSDADAVALFDMIDQQGK